MKVLARGVLLEVHLGARQRASEVYVVVLTIDCERLSFDVDHAPEALAEYWHNGTRVEIVDGVDGERLPYVRAWLTTEVGK